MAGAFAAMLLLVESGSVPTRADLTLGTSDALVADRGLAAIPGGRAIATCTPLGPELRPDFPMTPEEVVLAIANRLDLGDSTLATAAAWLAGSRLQLDVTPHRFFVKVRIPSS